MRAKLDKLWSIVCFMFTVFVAGCVIYGFIFPKNEPIQGNGLENILHALGLW
jgi:cytochrome b subunit of formate dehydrogenase